MTSEKPILNIVVALSCEANPIISHFKLKKLTSSFPVYANNEQSIFLIISGIGKIKSAMATTFLSTLTGNQPWNCFLNVGIAGSSQFLVGSAVLANKITEKSTNRSWYPFVPSMKEIMQCALITHDLPQQQYFSEMVDMEGSSFFQAAHYFVTQEHIQVIKIISDNCLEDQEKINTPLVKEIITNSIKSIEKIVKYLQNLSRNEFNLHDDNPFLSNFQDTWHFTFSQQLQLKEYLRRWQVNFKNENPFLFCQHEKNSKQVIQKIMSKLES